MGLGASEDFYWPWGFVFVRLGVFMICLVRLRALLDEICWPESIGGFFDWTEYIGGFFAERGAFVNLFVVWGINGLIHGY